jgi:hypothetical protein
MFQLKAEEIAHGEGLDDRSLIAPSNFVEWAQCVRVQFVRRHFYAAVSGKKTVLRMFTVFAGFSRSQAARIVGQGPHGKF